MKDFTLTELKSAAPIFDKTINRWIAPAYYHSDGRIGGYLFLSKLDAQKELALIITRLENKIKWQAEEDKKIQDAINAENKLIASYNGFLDKGPLKAGKQRKTLEAQVRYSGAIYTRKALIEQLIREGRFLSQNGLEDVAGVFLKLNKTEREYAEYVYTLHSYLKTKSYGMI